MRSTVERYELPSRFAELAKRRTANIASAWGRWGDYSLTMAAIQKELAESFELAEGQLAAEKLSGNRVKEEFWKGELAALHRMRCVVEANNSVRGGEAVPSNGVLGREVS
jgi:hypothetical protein